MANSSIRSSSNLGIRYNADIWIARRRTEIVGALTGRHSAFVIYFIKVRYVLFRNPCVCCEIIIESINSYLFQELPNADKLVVVVPLNPIGKQFPTIINSHPHSNSSTKPYPTTLCYPKILQRKIWLTGHVVWFHTINRNRKLRYEKGKSNMANWDIKKLVRILR